MNKFPRLVGIFAITTVVVFTLSYTPQLMSKQKEMEWIQTLADATRGLGRKLQEVHFQDNHDPPREDIVQGMGLLSVEYVKSTKVKAEHEQCERQLQISQRRSEDLAETLQATKITLQALKEEEDYADIDEDEEDY